MDKKDEGMQLMRQKQMEMQMLNAQLQQLQQQLNAVEQQTMEIEFVIDALGNLAKVEVDTEVLVPLSSGIFVKAKLVDNKELVVNVGSNTTVTKTIPEVQDMLKQQVAEVGKVKKELTDKFTEFASKMQNLQMDMMKKGD